MLKETEDTEAKRKVRNLSNTKKSSCLDQPFTKEGEQANGKHLLRKQNVSKKKTHTTVSCARIQGSIEENNPQKCFVVCGDL